MSTTPMAIPLSPSLSLPHTLSPKPLISSLSIPPLRAAHSQNPPQISLKPSPVWRISAVSADSLASDVNPVENTELPVSSGDDGVSNVISILLFIAFIGLSILTIGVIYIAVTDFLQKREKEKFEKEEANNKKKSGKKVRARARAGPRGFGQKIEEEDED